MLLKRYTTWALVFCCVFFTANESGVLAGKKENFSQWSLLGGYGFTHTNLGKTKIWVETVDVIGRYEKILIEDIGSSWYRGRHSLLIELPVYMVVDPVFDPMIGLNFLACWTFTANKKAMPYFFAGGGPVYTDADIPGMGAHLNGNYQFGGGLRYTLNDQRSLFMEYRFHHISNAGSEDPNDPLNSSKFLLGISF